MFKLFKKKKKDNQPKANTRYFEAVVRQVDKETSEAIAIYFDLPEEHKSYKPGQYITVIATIDNKEIRRSYSFCTAYGIDEHAGIGVKRVSGGKMSNYLNDKIQAGSKLKLMAQGGSFTPPPKNEAHHYCLLAGGSGITPMLSMIKHLLKNEPQSIITLVYANKDKDSIIFKSQLEALQEEHSNRLKIFHVLDDRTGFQEALQGMCTVDTFQTIFDTRHLALKTETSYWMCGPQGFMDVAENYLSSINIDEKAIHKESFVSTTKPKADTKSASKKTNEIYNVEVILDGETHHVDVKAGESILETALDKGIDLPYSCQSGLCTACRGKCLSGEVKMDDQDGLSDEEVEQGYVLTCISKPMSENIKIEIG